MEEREPSCKHHVGGTVNWENKLVLFKHYRKQYGVLQKVKCRSIIWSGALSTQMAKKNPPANAGDARDAALIPGLGRSPGVGNSSPLQLFLRIHGQKSPMGYTVHGVTRIRHDLATNNKSKEKIRCKLPSWQLFSSLSLPPVPAQSYKDSKAKDPLSSTQLWAGIQAPALTGLVWVSAALASSADIPFFPSHWGQHS